MDTRQFLAHHTLLYMATAREAFCKIKKQALFSFAIILVSLSCHLLLVNTRNYLRDLLGKSKKSPVTVELILNSNFGDSKQYIN